MPRAPSQIFVCRHGARLDAADANWQYTTPTAYDTPLTYGGWNQARNLGMRIGSLIVDRLEQIHGSAPPAENTGSNGNPPATTWVRPGSSSSNNPPSNAPRVKSVTAKVAAKLSSTRVVIHTSPFLRAIQTSIGVSAGISQQLHTSLPEGADTPLPPPPRPLLRLDGWLGEWLCEDYFAEISPPPASAVMITNAKVDLMRPSSAGGLMREDTPGGGYKQPVLPYPVGKSDPIPRGHVSHAKEFLDIDYVWDSTRFGNGGDYGEEWATMHKRVKKGFALTLEEYGKTGAPPPPGIKGKTHSRSASSSLPDGGKVFNETPQHDHRIKEVATELHVEQEEGDTVMIFVSHGAGCNAMIGALTNQPALMDIGLASLTMAVRRPNAAEDNGAGFAQDAATASFSYPTDVRSSGKAPSESCLSRIAASYEVRITASTSHLRSTHHRQQSSQYTVDNRLTPPGSDMSRSPSVSPAPSPSIYRPPTRKNTLSSYSYVKPIPLPSPAIPVSTTSAPTSGLSVNTGFPGTGILRPAMASVFGSGGGSSAFRRTASGGASSITPTKGLWRPIGLAYQGEEAVADEEDLDDKLKILNFGGPVSGGTSGTSTPSDTESKPSPGLWAGGGLPQREPGKRRWTVTDSN